MFFLYTLPHTAERVARQNAATVVLDVPFLFTRTERTHEWCEWIAYRWLSGAEATFFINYVSTSVNGPSTSGILPLFNKLPMFQPSSSDLLPWLTKCEGRLTDLQPPLTDLSTWDARSFYLVNGVKTSDVRPFTLVNEAKTSVNRGQNIDDLRKMASFSGV